MPLIYDDLPYTRADLNRREYNVVRAVFIILWLICISFWVLVGYVATHFVLKAW